MKKRYVVLFVILIMIPFIACAVTSRYGPWWGLVGQSSAPATPGDSDHYKLWVDTDTNILYLLGSGGTSDEVKTNSSSDLSKKVVLDPGTWYNSDTEVFFMTIDDDAPNGIIIDKWKCSCNVDPDTEIDADLRYADAWIGLANAADIDEIDTTSGVSSESTGSNINGGNAVANGKVVYLGFDADPEGTCTQMIFEMWYHAVN